MGGWSGPGAGFIPWAVLTTTSLSGRRHRHVEHLGELGAPLLAHRQQEACLTALEHEFADLVAEERAGLLPPLQPGRVRPCEAGEPRGQPPGALAPADLETDADRVRRLVVQRGDRELVH